MNLKEIPSIPGYFASACGLIFQKSGPGWMEIGQRFSNGYKTVKVPIDGKVKYRSVHRLVLEAFVGPCPDGMQCRHLNDHRADNRLENLKWGTPKENGEDKVANDVQPWGEEHYKAVWSEADIIEMRRLWNSGGDLSQIQERFGGLRPAIHHAVTGRTWKHIACDDPAAQPSRRPRLLVTAFGETKRYSEWVDDERCQVTSAGVIRARIKRGVPPEQAITNPPEELTEAFGERKLLKDWADDPRCVVTYQSLLRRLRKGVPIEEAITSEWCNTAPKKKSPNLKPDQVAEIRRRLDNGERGLDIAKDFGLSKTTVSKIKVGKNHRTT